MDRSGCFDFLWLQAHIYLALINNICADETLNWMIPFTKRHGVTKDISAFLDYRFFEKIYYSEDESFPMTTEKAGYWLYPCDHVGDLLTYAIYTDDTKTILYRSVI